MAPKGGKIISFEAFKQKGKIEEAGQRAEEGQEAAPESEAVQNLEEGHGEKKDCNCVVCTFKRENGVDLIKVLERARELNSRVSQGRFNPTDLREWRTKLQAEDVMSLVRRVQGLDEAKVQTHPTYSKAVFEMLLRKLRELRARHPGNQE